MNNRALRWLLAELGIRRKRGRSRKFGPRESESLRDALNRGVTLAALARLHQVSRKTIRRASEGYQSGSMKRQDVPRGTQTNNSTHSTSRLRS